MKTVYIASPYTIGDVAVNVRNSFLAADELVKLGFAPFPPLFSHFWHFLSPKPYETWTELDIEWLSRCDCVLRLDGESKGADIEVALAIENNIPVFYSIDKLALQMNKIIMPKDNFTKSNDKFLNDLKNAYIERNQQ